MEKQLKKDLRKYEQDAKDAVEATSLDTKYITPPSYNSDCYVDINGNVRCRSSDIKIKDPTNTFLK